jgi:hypothetical protein
MNPNIAALNGLIASLPKNTGLRRMAGVVATQEFRRIRDLPRREWSAEQTEHFVNEMSRILRKPNGTQTLRPLQAIALAELGTYGGLLGPIGVGYGKTLISLLAPWCFDSIKRPLLILPARLKDKTKAELTSYRHDWRIPWTPHIWSYESLGRVSHAEALDNLMPDLIVADEAHYLKNMSAAVTRRVHRFLKDKRIPFVALSGTLTSKSLLDFAHISGWALHECSPLPLVFAEVLDWAGAVDYQTKNGVRTYPGALSNLAGGSEDLADIRDGVRRRIVSTPGIVATTESALGCSLEIQKVSFELPPPIHEAFATLRESWETPDGWPLLGAMEVQRHACELALGFYYRWNPRPPQEWLDTRREYCRFVRSVLSSNRRGWDSPAAIAQACTKGLLDRELYDAWTAIKETFKPITEAVWLSDIAIRKASEWLDKHNGIVFTSHVKWAERLEAFSGKPYYGREGRDTSGQYIEDAKGPIIASFQSNKEGRNLQSNWHKALIVNVPTTGKDWEQLTGRLHRPGQAADCVEFYVWSLCAEHENAFASAKQKALYIGQTTGQVQKLQYADTMWPESQGTGPLWDTE